MSPFARHVYYFVKIVSAQKAPTVSTFDHDRELPRSQSKQCAHPIRIRWRCLTRRPAFLPDLYARPSWAQIECKRKPIEEKT